MKARILLMSAALFAAAIAVYGFQGSDQLTRSQLREMLVQLGYDVSDLNKTPGKETYQYKITQGGFDVPIAAEISPSGSYIWLTAFLKDEVPGGEKAAKLLQKNSVIQPSQFYVTKSGRLMIGLAIENRALTNPILRQRTEKIGKDVADTADAWK